MFLLLFCGNNSHPPGPEKRRKRLARPQTENRKNSLLQEEFCSPSKGTSFILALSFSQGGKVRWRFPSMHYSSSVTDTN